MRRIFEAVLQDSRYGMRILRKHPSFALTVTITLGLGIGATATIFSVINAVLLVYGSANLAAIPSLVNRTIQLNGESYTVVGVMSPGFQFPARRELWVPLTLDPEDAHRSGNAAGVAWSITRSGWILRVNAVAG